LLFLPEICVITKQECVMPLWKIYHPVGAFTAEDKHAFAQIITDLYARLPLPKFYVNVIFQEVRVTPSISVVSR
jgi:phenylpyruvate tautomerase PptA (4-oxalocrotonate tautomerase family)